MSALLETILRIVLVKAKDDELVDLMNAMRNWLNQKRFDTALFTCHRDRNAVVIRVGFSAEAEGDAFAERFDGVVEAAHADAAPHGRGERPRPAGRRRRKT